MAEDDGTVYRNVRDLSDGYWRSTDDAKTEAQFEDALRSLDALFALRRSSIEEYLS